MFYHIKSSINDEMFNLESLKTATFRQFIFELYKPSWGVEGWFIFFAINWN